jgi:quinolinate synthase
VFCGVHFMAESADVLTGDHQRVILPDLNAGCSMADMADIDQVEEAWDEIAGRHRDRPGRADHLHELLRRAEGVRRPARRRGVHVVERAGRARVGVRAGDKVLFFPDQHLGRNTGFDMGYGDDDMRVWNPRLDSAASRSATSRTPRFLWKGHCSVHQRFRPSTSRRFRAEHPGVR